MIRTLGRLLFVTLIRSAAQTATATPERRERAQQYNRQKNRLILVGLVVGVLGGSLFALSRIPVTIRNWARSITGNRVGSRSLALVAFALIETAARLPLTYYSGYVLEHRFGLSNQSRWAWAKDQIKGLVIALPFAVLIGNAVLMLIDRWPRRWWAIATALSVPFTVLLAQLAPVLIFPLFNRFEPLKNQQLARRLKELAAQSGINVAEVLQMDMSRQTNKANAFFAGLGRTRRIVLADTLLDNFTPEEIEVVVAHEIAHQAHHDIWRFIAVGTLFTALGSYLVNRLGRDLIHRLRARTGVGALDDVAAFPLLGWLLTLIGLVLGPIQNAYSRRVERAADAFALNLMRNPRAFIGAMQRLGDLNLAEEKPSALIKYTLYSHPPIAERIAHAREYAREHHLLA